MDPTIIAALIVNYGLPFAERMIQLWETKTAVTTTEWAKLKTLVLLPEDALRRVAAAAGLSMDDPKVVALAELIKPKTA